MMTKHEFLARLDKLIKSIPEQERNDILFDYHSHFEAGLAEGKSEEEIAKSLGHPNMIAKELLANYHISVAQSQPSLRHVGRAVIATVSLGFFNLIFVLGPFIALFCVIIAFYAVAIALLLAPFSLFLPFFFPVEPMEWVQMGFLSTVCVGLGLLLLVGMIYVTRWCYQFVLKYLQLNLRIIKGRN